MDEIRTSFEKAVVGLPAAVRARVCEEKCSRPPGSKLWELRDANGNLLNPPQEVTRSVTVPRRAPEKTAPSQRGKNHVLELYESINHALKKLVELDETMAEAIEHFAAEIDALKAESVTKSLDMEAYDAMGDIAARLERIEGELQEQASGKVQYRGYWRSGEIAQEGDCFSHNGSTYRANCRTETEPGTAGGDWNTLARGAKYEREKRR